MDPDRKKRNILYFEISERDIYVTMCNYVSFLIIIFMSKAQHMLHNIFLFMFTLLERRARVHAWAILQSRYSEIILMCRNIDTCNISKAGYIK